MLPGLNLNLSTKGISLSAGVRGASVNFSKRGTFVNLGIPGTGISYRERISPPPLQQRTRTKLPATKPPPLPRSSSQISTSDASDSWALQLTEELLQKWMPYGSIPNHDDYERALIPYPFPAQAPSGEAENPQVYGELRKQWEEAEVLRVKQLEHLLAGDPLEYQNLACAVVENFNFPFMSSCHVELDEPGVIYLAIDLPELEDIVPTINSGIAKHTGIDFKSSSKAHSNQYRSLVFRQVIFMAVEVLSYLPLTRELHVGAFTQRQVGTEVKDCFILNVMFHREGLKAALNLPEFHQNASLELFPAKYSIDPSSGLRTIAPPSWYENLQPN